jgi:hypothetical protein
MVIGRHCSQGISLECNTSVIHETKSAGCLSLECLDIFEDLLTIKPNTAPIFKSQVVRKIAIGFRDRRRFLKQTEELMPLNYASSWYLGEHHACTSGYVEE